HQVISYSTIYGETVEVRLAYSAISCCSRKEKCNICPTCGKNPQIRDGRLPLLLRFGGTPYKLM
ncbi:hypothetical protein RZP54_30410, partial [Raoultella ornithinolytica]|uniref:hypothetical protein n=1 Tax=Raoultella ornithinolytica TaxID=54291 RepID=UPI00292BCAD0